MAGAERAFREALRQNPGFAGDARRAGIGYAYGRSGRTKEARTVLRALLAQVNAGDRSQAQGELASAIATVFLGLGDRAQALTWLERARDLHSGSMLYLAADPVYKPLHDEPRYQALLKRVHLIA